MRRSAAPSKRLKPGDENDFKLDFTTAPASRGGLTLGGFLGTSSSTSGVLGPLSSTQHLSHQQRAAVLQQPQFKQFKVTLSWSLSCAEQSPHVAALVCLMQLHL